MWLNNRIKGSFHNLLPKKLNVFNEVSDKEVETHRLSYRIVENQSNGDE